MRVDNLHNLEKEDLLEIIKDTRSRMKACKYDLGEEV